MVANLNGVVFDQIYPDNSGGAVFDTDGDGTATQEDEFISVRNTTGSDIDISGWQVWSDSQGVGAPDTPSDGLFHTFPPGTVLAAGETLYVINEITGTPESWAQEASEGGLESGAGGVSTNLLTEGGNNSVTESVALVDPSTGDFIVFNMAPVAENISGQSGFPGTNLVAEEDGDSVQSDPNAGSSYQYDAETDSYVYAAVFVPCFAAGTLIATSKGEIAVEDLEVGDLIETMDHGLEPLRAIMRRDLDFEAGIDPKHKPIEFKPGSLGQDLPRQRLIVSPQHRMLVTAPDGRQVLAPAKALTGAAKVRVMAGRKTVTYIQLVFGRHEIVRANGAWTESFYPGAYAVASCDVRTQHELFEIFPELREARALEPARPLLKVQEARALAVKSAA